jgi:hypothetical protein
MMMMMFRFVLDQYAELDIHSASSLVEIFNVVQTEPVVSLAFSPQVWWIVDLSHNRIKTEYLLLLH